VGSSTLKTCVQVLILAFTASVAPLKTNFECTQMARLDDYKSALLSRCQKQSRDQWKLSGVHFSPFRNCGIIKTLARIHLAKKSCLVMVKPKTSIINLLAQMLVEKVNKYTARFLRLEVSFQRRTKFYAWLRKK